MADFGNIVNTAYGNRNQREQLRQQAETRNQNLSIMGYDFSNGQMSIRNNSPAEQEQLAAKEAVIRTKALFGKLFKDETARAFEDFSLTGDASYLNNDLNSSPEKKAAWAKRGVHLVSNIDFDSDHSLLSRSGLTPTMYDTDEKREVLRRNAYKLYDGKDWSIGLANQAMAETGAFKTLGNRRAAPAIDNYKQFVGLLSGPKVNPNTAEGHKYEKQITAAAEKYNLPPDLLAAMMHQESRGNPNAKSPKGAAGLMQLMPETAAELGVTDPHNPDQNIDAGAKYLRQQLDKYGDVKLALAAYNAGPGNVDKYGGVPPFGETQNYIQKITANLDDGGQYYNRTSDDVYNTIMEHDRRVALAAQGKTPEQGDRELAQKDRELGQKDRALDIEEQGLGVKLEEIKAKLATEGKTTTQKDLDAAANKTNDLYDQFGGEEQFYSTDLTNKDTPEYRDAFNKMVEIEKLTGMAPKETDEKEWKEIRTLINLSGDVANMTEEQTGLIDKQLNNVKKYLDDNLTTKEAASAWTAYRNIYIHSMAGTAQSEAEAKRIAESFGKLDMKLGAVISQFATQLKEVDARLESTSSNLLPLSAKIRMGTDKAKLQQARDGVQLTLNYLNARKSFIDGKSNKDPGSYDQYVKEVKARPSLDSFVTE